MRKVGYTAAVPVLKGGLDDEFDKPRRRGSVIPITYGNIGAIIAGADLVVITAIGALSSAICNHTGHGWLGDLKAFAVIGLVYAVMFVVINQARNFYRSDKLLQSKRSMVDFFVVWCLTAMSIMSIAFVAGPYTYLYPGASMLFFGTGLLVMPIYRTSARLALAYAIVNNLLAGKENIVLIGSISQLQGVDVHENLRRHGYGVVEQIRIRLNDGDSILNSRSIMAATNRLKEVVKSNRIDEIFLLLDIGDRRTMDLVMERIREVPIPVRLLFDKRASSLLALGVDDLGAARSVKLRGGPLTEAQQWSKRIVDVVLSLIGVIVLSPVFVGAAIAIRLDSPGPILFRQRRAGFGGRIFRIFKFRTMTSMDDGDVVKQAQKHDKRVTRVGRFLRRSSIDELPQLLNVLSGEMSLVGPRPHALSHDNEYSRQIATYALRHHMKPGLTGWAQVNGYRGETNTIELMQARVEHDLWYVGHWSFMLDIKTIGMTVMELISPRNVY